MDPSSYEAYMDDLICANFIEDLEILHKLGTNEKNSHNFVKFARTFLVPKKLLTKDAAFRLSYINRGNKHDVSLALNF